MAIDELHDYTRLSAARSSPGAPASDALVDGTEALLGTAEPFADLDVPPTLEQSLARHRVHLAELVRTMKIAGISDQQIVESVEILLGWTVGQAPAEPLDLRLGRSCHR